MVRGTHHRTLCTVLVSLLALALCNNGVCALENGMAIKPPMGWNSWNTLVCDISEDTIKQIAQVMVKTGLRDLGYEYINLDDCWEGGRDSQGYIIADASKFPSGMKALGDYLHSLGFKFGIYTSSGPRYSFLPHFLFPCNSAHIASSTII